MSTKIETVLYCNPNPKPFVSTVKYWKRSLWRYGDLWTFCGHNYKLPWISSFSSPLFLSSPVPSCPLFSSPLLSSPLLSYPLLSTLTLHLRLYLQLKLWLLRVRLVGQKSAGFVPDFDDPLDCNLTVPYKDHRHTLSTWCSLATWLRVMITQIYVLIANTNEETRSVERLKSYLHT